MTLPPAVAEFLEIQGWGQVRGLNALGGGCINHALRLETQHGPPALVKFNPNAPSDLFCREAEGLAALRTAAGGPRVPNVLGVGQGWVVLEFIKAQPHEGSRVTRGTIGFAPPEDRSLIRFKTDNYLGSTPQNNRSADGLSSSRTAAAIGLRPPLRLIAQTTYRGRRVPSFAAGAPTTSLIHAVVGRQSDNRAATGRCHDGGPLRLGRGRLGMMHLFGVRAGVRGLCCATASYPAGATG
jgi:hypothetical protein